jgi:translation initiation factor 2 alpha subunit (eIF-2alpha)
MAEHYAALAESEQKIDVSLKRIAAAERAARRKRWQR